MSENQNSLVRKQQIELEESSILQKVVQEESLGQVTHSSEQIAREEPLREDRELLLQEEQVQDQHLLAEHREHQELRLVRKFTKRKTPRPIGVFFV